MSLKNQAIVERAVEEVWNRGNLAAIADLFAPEFVSFDPNNSEVRGHQAFRQYVSMYRAAFPDLHFVVEDSLVTGDEVAVRWTVTGMQQGGRPGRPVNGNGAVVAGMTIYRFAGDKISESWMHWDTAGMLLYPGPAAN